MEASRPRRRPHPPTAPIQAAGPGPVTSSPAQDPDCAETANPISLVRLPGRCPHLVATLGQDRDRRPTDTTRRSGDEHRTGRGLQAAILQRHHGHRRGEPSSADRHRVARREPALERDHPVGRHTLVFGVTAMAGHAKLVPVDQNRGRPRRSSVQSLATTSPARSIPGMSGLIRATFPSARTASPSL